METCPDSIRRILLILCDLSISLRRACLDKIIKYSCRVRSLVVRELPILVLQHDLVHHHVVDELIWHLCHHEVIDLHLSHLTQIVKLDELDNVARGWLTVLICQNLGVGV